MEWDILLHIRIQMCRRPSHRDHSHLCRHEGEGSLQLKRRQRLLVFLMLVGLYVAGNVIVRWLRFLLFGYTKNTSEIQEHFGPKPGGPLSNK